MVALLGRPADRAVCSYIRSLTDTAIRKLPTKLSIFHYTEKNCFSSIIRKFTEKNRPRPTEIRLRFRRRKKASVVFECFGLVSVSAENYLLTFGNFSASAVT